MTMAQSTPKPRPQPAGAAAETVSATIVKGLNMALHELLAEDESVMVLGQDVGWDEGVFRVTEGLVQKYGEMRVLDTPLAEANIVGAAIGMAMAGLKPIAEMQFSGFSYQAFHQVEQHMSRYRNRTRGRFTVPMVIRMPYGGGIRAIEQHSESREVCYAHLPGVKLVVPSTPRNARALLRASVLDPDPVIFFEPKASYRAFKEPIPVEPETMPIGRAQVVREGKDITLISFGAMMRPTLEAADELAEEGVSAEVVDLLSISPLDSETFCGSVEKTGRAVVVHEAPRHLGVAAEVTARIVEDRLLYLEAPVKRVTGYDVTIPFFAKEKFYLPDANRIVKAARETLEF
jgi:pyruvate dehydrogenase E1 component beta subunit